MTGRIQDKNGYWYMVLNTYDSTGKRKLKWIATGLIIRGNKTKAQSLLKETIREYEIKQEQGVTPSDVTVAEYIQIWLKYSKKNVDQVTYEGYVVLANSHVISYFEPKKILITNLTRKQIQIFIDHKSESGRIDGQGGLSPNSVRKLKNIILQTCRLAVKDEILLRSPCDLIDIPPAKHIEYNFYTADQMEKLFLAIEGDYLVFLIKITALFGLRRSEVLGIKWNSIDFEKNTLTIKHTVVQQTTLIAKDKTKNASSHRSFPLLLDTRDVFQTIKKEQQQNALIFGKAYHKSDYVFCWSNGVPFQPSFVTRHFTSLLKKKGFPHIRFHDLRHSCASILIDLDFTLKDIQEWLGHSDIKMTANVYSHLDVNRKKLIAQRLSERLMG